jgi:hypothetical protein
LPESRFLGQSLWQALRDEIRLLSAGAAFRAASAAQGSQIDIEPATRAGSMSIIFFAHLC